MIDVNSNLWLKSYFMLFSEYLPKQYLVDFYLFMKERVYSLCYVIKSLILSWSIRERVYYFLYLSWSIAHE